MEGTHEQTRPYFTAVVQQQQPPLASLLVYEQLFGPHDDLISYHDAVLFISCLMMFSAPLFLQPRALMLAGST